MDEIIAKVIELVIAVLCIVISRYVVPYVKGLVGEKKFVQIKEWIVVFVTAAEQLYAGDKRGEEKCEYVIKLATEKAKDIGIKITEEQLRAMLESALLELKADWIITN